MGTAGGGAVSGCDALDVAAVGIVLLTVVATVLVGDPLRTTWLLRRVRFCAPMSRFWLSRSDPKSVRIQSGHEYQLLFPFEGCNFQRIELHNFFN